MGPGDYHCFPNQATAVGSCSYYAVRFAPARYRSDLALILAWHNALQAIAQEISDIGVAEVKLQWWREELLRVGQQRPQHPISRHLIRIIDQNNIPIELFQACAQSITADISKRRYQDLTALIEYSEMGHAGLFEILGRCGGCSAPPQIAYARQIGSFVRLAEIILNLGGDLRQERCFLPQNLMFRAKLNCDTLVQWKNKIALEQLLRSIAQRARNRLGEARSSFSAARSAGLTPVTVLAALHEAMLDEIGIDMSSVVHQRISLTPLRMLWVGWRSSKKQ